MEETDLSLLARFAQEQDAEAFSEVVSRYQVFVYTTCLRILGNQADAEDVAQECFLRLARKAGTVRSSLSGWLHRCAADMAVSEARRRAAQKNREEEHGKMNSSHTDEPGWAELSPHVDKALNEMPEDLRLVIIEHFLQRRTQKEIAEELGVSAMTISRRIAAAIEELRKTLKKAGVVASAVALAAFLSEQSSAAVPASLTASLGKLAAAGTEWSTAAAEASSWVGKGVVPGALPAAAKMKIVAAALACVIVAGGTVWLIVRGRTANTASEAPPSHSQEETQANGSAAETAGAPAAAEDGQAVSESVNQPAIQWGKPKDGIVCGLRLDRSSYVLGQKVKVCVYLKNTLEREIKYFAKGISSMWDEDGVQIREMIIDVVSGDYSGELLPHSIPPGAVREVLAQPFSTRPTITLASGLYFTTGKTKMAVRCRQFPVKKGEGTDAGRLWGVTSGTVIVEVAEAEQPNAWAGPIQEPKKREPLHDVLQEVRGKRSKQDQLWVVPGGPHILRMSKEGNLSVWLDTLAFKQQVALMADKDTWLLFRSKQLNDNDRVWIESIDRSKVGRGRIEVVCRRAVWNGRATENATYHPVFGVNLGRLAAGTYEATWVVRECSFREFDEERRPKDIEAVDSEAVHLKKGFLCKPTVLKGRVPVRGPVEVILK